MGKKVKAAGVPTEEYVVKFWIKNETTGFKEQQEESVRLHAKGQHKKAEHEVMGKYRKLGRAIDIISVTYQ